MAKYEIFRASNSEPPTVCEYVGTIDADSAQDAVERAADGWMGHDLRDTEHLYAVEAEERRRN